MTARNEAVKKAAEVQCADGYGDAQGIQHSAHESGPAAHQVLDCVYERV